MFLFFPLTTTRRHCQCVNRYLLLTAMQKKKRRSVIRWDQRNCSTLTDEEFNGFSDLK